METKNTGNNTGKKVKRMTLPQKYFGDKKRVYDGTIFFQKMKQLNAR
jgi:hypothetical protein